jgi:hypothetical protein
MFGVMLKASEWVVEEAVKVPVTEEVHVWFPARFSCP